MTRPEAKTEELTQLEWALALLEIPIVGAPICGIQSIVITETAAS